MKQIKTWGGCISIKIIPGKLGLGTYQKLQIQEHLRFLHLDPIKKRESNTEMSKEQVYHLTMQ